MRLSQMLCTNGTVEAFVVESYALWVSTSDYNLPSQSAAADKGHRQIIDLWSIKSWPNIHGLHRHPNILVSGQVRAMETLGCRDNIGNLKYAYK
jgi:hypothetical protein